MRREKYWQQFMQDILEKYVIKQDMKLMCSRKIAGNSLKIGICGV
jgi:hypothetical protein